MRNWRGPKSCAGLINLTMAGILGSPFFLKGEDRLENLWYIYMSPMYDEESVFILFFVAFSCLVIGVLYFTSTFSNRISDYISSYSVGRFYTFLSIIMSLIALMSFSQPIIMGLIFGTIFVAWSWWRSDPYDRW
jgi:hypothetical protein